MYKRIYQQFVVKSTDNNDVTIFGYASVYNIVDQQNDIITQEAFMDLCAKNVKFLWQHDPTKPIGLIKSCIEDNYGLLIEAVINGATQLGHDAITLVIQKAVTGLSIGLNILDSYRNNLGQRVITKAELLEVSIVTFPANSYAQITNINNQNQEAIMNTNYVLSQEMKSNDTIQITRKIRALEEKVDNLTNIYFRPEVVMNDTQEYKTAFCDYIRKGNINHNINNIIQKSFSSAENEGGVMIIPALHNKIITGINARSPIRQLASIETISTNALDVVIEDGKFISGWVGENEERAETKTPQLQQKRILVHEMYAQPKATQALIDDSAIQIESWLGERLSDSFVKIENDAFINGNGKKQPKGILHADHKIKTLKLQEDNIPNLLLDLVNDLDENYLVNATFLMNRATLSEIQKLKDANQRSIWQQAISEALPQTIYGIPVLCCAEVPSIEKKKNFIVFGDFKSAYKIVDRSGMSLMRDPYTDKPFVKFYAVKRVGGDVVNSDALRIASIE